MKIILLLFIYILFCNDIFSQNMMYVVTKGIFEPTEIVDNSIIKMRMFVLVLS
ncbi:MAG TPA: hypothetical protein PK887_07750 [Ignavibacteriales bacterium]|nr:hypothetical protein [Ignavibacteriales bacterium]